MVIGIVGFIGSGKDTAADILVAGENRVKDSFAAPLKDVVCSIFGWPREMLEGSTSKSREFRNTPDMFWSRKLGIPNFTPRLAMQLIGTDVLRKHFDESIWLHSLEYRLMRIKKQHACTIVVSDARFRNELDLIRSLGGTVVWIQRGPLPEWYDIAKAANAGDKKSLKIMTTTYRDIHRSEWDWVGYPANHIVQNNGTIEDLKNCLNAIYSQ